MQRACHQFPQDSVIGEKRSMVIPQLGFMKGIEKFASIGSNGTNCLINVYLKTA